MPSKISWCNKEIMLQIGRSAGWVSIVYLLGLLFALPVKILMIVSDKYQLQNFTEVHNLFQLNYTIQIALLFIMPVLITVFLFRFLHVKQAADLMHSLPLKRGKLYHHYALSGVLLLVLPVIITAIVVLCMHTVLDLTPYFDKGDVLYWAGMTILINLILYAGSVFVAIMTGLSAVHAVLSYIFLLFPAGMMVLLVDNLKALFYGFPSDYYLSSNLEKMSPLGYAAFLDNRVYETSIVIIYILAAVLLYFLAWFFFKKRKVESASEAIAFSKLRLIFKYGITFCMMLLGGMYFSEVQSGSLGWTIFGYAGGAILGYYVAETVLQKTWRIRSAGKGLLVYAVILGVALTVVKALGIYENTIPEQNQIESVVLTGNLDIFLDPADPYAKFYRPRPLQQEDNIAAVRKLHQQILNDKEMNQKESKNDSSENILLVYKLKDGSKLIREYTIDQQLYSDLYKPVYESEEYKRNSKEIFRVSESKARYITIFSNEPLDKQIMIVDPGEVKKLISLLQTDILSETYEDSRYYENSWATMEINMEKNLDVSIPLNPSYQKVTAWLKEKGLLKKATITEDDLEYALIAKNNFGNVEDPEVVERKAAKQPGALKVTNKQQLKSSLDSAGVLMNGRYVVVFHYKQESTPQVFYFDDQHAPDFVKQHFQ